MEILAIVLIFLVLANLVILIAYAFRVEKNQESLKTELRTAANGITQTGAATQGLSQITSSLRTDLSLTLKELSALQSHAAARGEIEGKTFDSIQRLEHILAGSKSKGRAGENILNFIFEKLPVEWQAKDFKVGNKSVEFALKFPNDLVLPIDSKWPSTNLLEQLAVCEDQAQKENILGQIHKDVMKKIKEVKQYIEENRTVNFALAAVPDSVFEICSDIQVEAFVEHKVILIGYSMFLPYLLSAFQMAIQSSRTPDMEKFLQYVQTVKEKIMSLQDELDGRFAKALTELFNSKTKMATSLSEISGKLSSL